MRIELAYSLHLGSDKNRKTSSKKIAESNSSGKMIEDAKEASEEIFGDKSQKEF